MRFVQTILYNIGSSHLLLQLLLSKNHEFNRVLIANHVRYFGPFSKWVTFICTFIQSIYLWPKYVNLIFFIFFAQIFHNDAKIIIRIIKCCSFKARCSIMLGTKKENVTSLTLFYHLFFFNCIE